MPREALFEWGITLFIFASLVFLLAQAWWPRKQPENYTQAVYSRHDVETRAEAEARAIIEECWRTYEPE